MWQLSSDELLDRWRELDLVAAAQGAAAAEVLAEIDARGLTEQRFGLSTATWLTAGGRRARRSAGRELSTAQALTGRFGATAAALAAGDVSPEQAAAVVTVLDGLPAEFTDDQVTEAESTILGFARDGFDPRELTRLSRRVVELVAPEVVDEADEIRLARAEQHARRTAFLSFADDGEGATFLSGKLATVDAAPLRAAVEAIAARPRTGADLPGGVDARPIAARRADALVEIAAGYLASGEAPDHGGDRPRVTVLVDHKTLARGLGPAVLGDDRAPVSVAEARRLACDADILPAVLAGPSQVLDVGRSRRLFDGALRQALVIRDGGCVFPGCDRPPRACDAHHISPWWNGGETSLRNGVLLCPPHHRLVEPDRTGDPEQRWQIRMGPDRLPETIPPAWKDRARIPVRHQRHRPLRR